VRAIQPAVITKVVFHDKPLALLRMSVIVFKVTLVNGAPHYQESILDQTGRNGSATELSEVLPCLKEIAVQQHQCSSGGQNIVLNKGT
jgi:hypothetical protein